LLSLFIKRGVNWTHVITEVFQSYQLYRSSLRILLVPLCNTVVYRTLKFCQTILIRIETYTSTLTSERIYFLNPNDIEFGGVKVSLKSFSIYVTCYIPHGSDLNGNKNCSFSSFRERYFDCLGDFNLPDISWSPSTDSLVSTPLSVHHFDDGLLEFSLQQVSFIRNSLNRQLDLVIVLDPSEVTVSTIDPHWKL